MQKLAAIQTLQDVCENHAEYCADLRAVVRAELCAEKWQRCRNELQKWFAETVQMILQSFMQYLVQKHLLKTVQSQIALPILELTV